MVDKIARRKISSRAKTFFGVVVKAVKKVVKKKKATPDIKFTLIPDTPIPADKQSEVYFGYKEIAETLALIAEKSPTPFTIGLFGKWGTGKSTILNQLKNYLSKDSVFVVFDIWKYEADSLRRSFILDIALQLKELQFTTDDYVEEVKERLYLNINKPKEFFNYSWRGLVLFSIITIAVFLLQVSIIGRATNITLAASLMAGLVSAFPEIIKKSISVDKISVGKDRLNSPEEFEGEFKNLLLKLKTKKLIVGIDNLDRVNRDSAVELLGTVKTFLMSDKNIENVIFVIACDDDAIKEHLKAIYLDPSGKSEFDPEEFLRKFFNIILRVPKFLNLELDAYTKRLLKQANIPVFKKSVDLELIISYTFRDNPREIKQFINNVSAYYLLAKRRELPGDVDKKFLDRNISFITKLLIIRQKYPEVYGVIEKKTLRDGASWQEILAERDDLSKELSPDKKEAFKEFLVNTDWIKPSSDNVSVFLTLKRSEEEKSLPGWDQFVNAAINLQTETTTKIIKRFKK